MPSSSYGSFGSSLWLMAREMWLHIQMLTIWRSFNLYLETACEFQKFHHNPVAYAANNPFRYRTLMRKYRAIQALNVLCIGKAIHFCGALLLPMNEFQRFLWYDWMLFYRLDQRVNMVQVFLGLLLPHFWRSLYFNFDLTESGGGNNRPTTLEIVRQVIVQRRRDRLKATLFLHDRMMFTSFSHMRNIFGITGGLASRRVCDIVRLTTRAYLRSMLYFSMFVISLYFIFQAYVLTCIKANARYFFGTAPGIAVLLYVEILQATWSQVWLHCYVTLHANLSGCILASALTTFIRLRQASDLLHDISLKGCCGDIGGRRPLVFGKRQKHQVANRLIRFTHFHTSILLDVINANRYFGSILLSFIVVNLGVSSYLLISILSGVIRSPLTVYAFSHYIAYEYVGIFAFHAIAAMHTERIHRCAPRLLAWSASTSGGSQRCIAATSAFTSTFTTSRLPLHVQIRIALYIDKFHVHHSKMYGLTYSHFGLMSMKRFIEFLLLYAELLMYWWKMIMFEQH